MLQHDLFSKFTIQSWIRNLLWIHFYREGRCVPELVAREKKEIKNHIRGLDLNPEFLLYRNHFFLLHH